MRKLRLRLEKARQVKVAGSDCSCCERLQILGAHFQPFSQLKRFCVP